MTTQNLYEEWARKTRQEGYERGNRETKSLYEQWSAGWPQAAVNVASQAP